MPPKCTDALCHRGRRRSSMKWFLGFILAALCLAPAASAAVLISAYPQTSTGAFALNGTPPLNVAAGFTVGAAPFDLNSARVQLSAVGIAQFPTSVVTADLYGGTASTPSGSPLVGFSIPAGTVSGQATDLTLTPIAPFALQAANSYWIVLRASPTVEGNLSVNVVPNPATGAFATYAGATQDGNLPPQSRHEGSNILFEINGQVPEPGAAWALAIAPALIASRRGRRK